MARAVAVGGPLLAEDNDLQTAVGPFVVHVNGLLVPHDKQPFEEWDRLGGRLAVFDKGIQFAVGDWANEIEDRFGEEAAQAVDVSRWAEETLKVYRWVSKSVPRHVRMLDRGLSFRHHMAVAKLTARQQEKWLKKALNEDGDIWTVARLQAAMAASEDLPVVGWRLLVTCKDIDERRALRDQLEGKGYACREVDKRAKKKKDKEAA